MTHNTEDLRCAAEDPANGRCTLDADSHQFPGMHAWEKVPGPPGPPQKWQAQKKRADLP